MSSNSRSDMPLLQHLGELRRRLIYCVVTVVLFTIVGFCFADLLLTILTKPFISVFPPQSIIGTGPAEAFILKLKTAIFSGILLSLPIIFYHLWLFITPGLYASEKKLLIPFVLSSSVLFLVGAFFCYYSVLPFAFDFFYEQYRSLDIVPQIRISELLSFVIMILLAFGFIFEVPVLAFLLARAGLLNHLMLLRWFRVSCVVIFIVAAILTPPDVLTQLLMAGPLLLLYALSIVIVKFTYKERNLNNDNDQNCEGL